MDNITLKIENIGQKSGRLGGLDILRVIMCVLVVILHANPFSVPEQYNPLSTANPTIYNIMYFDCFALCVPAFLTLSCYLFFKNSVKNKNYPLKRLGKLTLYAVIWNVILTLVLYNKNVKNLFVGKSFFDIFLVAIGNHNISYYLYMQIFINFILFVLQFALRKLSVKNFLIAVFSGLVVTMPISFFSISVAKFFIGEINGAKLGYSNIFCFLPCIFAGLICYYFIDVKKSDKATWISFGVSAVAFIILSILDWKVQHAFKNLWSYHYFPSSRFQLPFSSMALILGFSLVKKQSIPILSNLSKLTFGVFLMHVAILPNVLDIYFKLFNTPNNFVVFLITLVFSFALASVFRIPFIRDNRLIAPLIKITGL